jgi:hypothetical protein
VFRQVKGGPGWCSGIEIRRETDRFGTQRGASCLCLEPVFVLLGS